MACTHTATCLHSVVPPFLFFNTRDGSISLTSIRPFHSDYLLLDDVSGGCALPARRSVACSKNLVRQRAAALLSSLISECVPGRRGRAAGGAARGARRKLTRNGKHFVVLNADDHPGQEAATH
jgi:hypothetical protein